MVNVNKRNFFLTSNSICVERERELLQERGLWHSHNFLKYFLNERGYLLEGGLIE